MWPVLLWFVMWPVLLAAGHLAEAGLQAVQADVPRPAIRRQPGVEFAQRLRPEPVQPPLLVHPGLDQPGLAEHPQVLGDRGLAHRQRVDEFPDRPLAVPDEVEEPPPPRL